MFKPNRPLNELMPTLKRFNLFERFNLFLSKYSYTDLIDLTESKIILRVVQDFLLKEIESNISYPWLEGYVEISQTKRKFQPYNDIKRDSPNFGRLEGVKFTGDDGITAKWVKTTNTPVIKREALLIKFFEFMINIGVTDINQEKANKIFGIIELFLIKELSDDSKEIIWMGKPLKSKIDSSVSYKWNIVVKQPTEGFILYNTNTSKFEEVKKYNNGKLVPALELEYLTNSIELENFGEY